MLTVLSFPTDVSRPLSTVQRLMLCSAIQREGLVRVPLLAIDAAKGLLNRGLVREVPSEPGQPSWRPGWALVVTPKGRRAVAQQRPRGLPAHRASDEGVWPIAEKLIEIFNEAHGRPPGDIVEFEAFLLAGVRTARRRAKH
jgi:hypothetical protein